MRESHVLQHTSRWLTRGNTMNRLFRKSVLALGALAAVGSGLAQAELVDRFTSFTKGHNWELVSNEQLDFSTHHPQGMARVGDSFFLSSVEIIERTERYETPQDGYDRTAGVGRGWLFRMNMNGELQDSVERGEVGVEHPGDSECEGQCL